MNLKFYQCQVLVGVALAALIEGLFWAAGPLSSGISETIEGASFLFCCVGILTGGRELRAAFERFGRSKDTARHDLPYMRARTQLQITSVAAVAAIGVLLARRCGVGVAVPLVAAAALGISLPFINSLSGWVAHE